MLLKQPLQGSLHLISGVVLEFYRQICRKLIRIVVDFIKVIPVLVISAMSTLDIIDFVAERSFQSLVIIVRTNNIFLFCGKRSSQNNLCTALEHSRTRREHPREDHKKQSGNQNKQNRFRVCGAKLRDSFCDIHGSLSCFARCLACTLGCRSRCRSGILTGFGGSIFFLDCPFLLPTGERVGTGIGIVLFELLIQGIYICFI